MRGVDDDVMGFTTNSSICNKMPLYENFAELFQRKFDKDLALF